MFSDDPLVRQVWVLLFGNAWRGWVLPACHAGRPPVFSGLRAWAVLFVVVLSAGFGFLGTGAAQAQVRVQAGAVASANALTEPDGLEAHYVVSQWLRQDLVDRVSVPTMRRAGVVAVAVTLRRGGVIVGLGEAARTDIKQHVVPADPVDITKLLARASETAFEQVRKKLKLNPAGADPLLGDQLSDIAGTLLVDVQIGHGLQEILLTDDDPVFAVLDRYAPGYHGLRLADDEGIDQRFAWPSLALQSNSGGDRELRRIMVGMGQKPEAWMTLARPGRQTLQRFEVMHIVQPSAIFPAQRLVRGQQILPINAVRRATLLDISSSMALHLYRHTSPEGVVSGAYLPTSGRYQEQRANDVSAAFACYALARHISSAGLFLGDDGSTPSERLTTRVVSAGSRLYQLVADDPAAQPLVTAFVLLALADGGLAIEDGSAEALTQGLLALHTDERGFVNKPGSEESLSPTAQAVMTAALAAAYAESQDAATGRVVAARWLALWSQVLEGRSDERPNDLIDPFVWAWLSLIESRVGDSLQASGIVTPAQRNQILGYMAQQLDEAAAIQVQTVPSLGPRDVYGGFLIDGFPGAAPPMPDWRSAQVLFAMALCQRSEPLEQLPGADVLGWRFTAELGARFVGQLMMDDWSTYYTRVPGQAIGGVRQSVIDNRLDPVATAMGLLAINELLQTKAGM